MGDSHPSLRTALGGPHPPRPGDTALPWEKDMAVTTQMIPEASRCRRGGGEGVHPLTCPGPARAGNGMVPL